MYVLSLLKNNITIIFEGLVSFDYYKSASYNNMKCGIVGVVKCFEDRVMQLSPGLLDSADWYPQMPHYWLRDDASEVSHALLY